MRTTCTMQCLHSHVVPIFKIYAECFAKRRRLSSLFAPDWMMNKLTDNESDTVISCAQQRANTAHLHFGASYAEHDIDKLLPTTPPVCLCGATSLPENDAYTRHKTENGTKTDDVNTCEAILFLEPKMNVRSVQHCVSGRRKRTQTLTTTDVLKTAVKVRAAC